MTIFQCMSCPKIKAGQPWRSSAQKPWLCDLCSEKIIREKSVTSINKPVLRLKPLVNVRRG